MRVAGRVSLLGILWLGASAASAHEVPVEQVVTIDVTPTPTRLDVLVQVPIAALEDANLPRDENRRLAQPGADDVLRVVARDIANRLDVRLAAQPLSYDAAQAAITDTQQSVRFAFAYQAREGAMPSLSMALQTFRAGTRQITALARYHESGGDTRTFTVTNGSQRVLFEPGLAYVISDFAGRAFRAASRGGDYLLWLFALAVPLRAAATRRAALIAFFVAQTVGAVITGLLPLPAESHGVVSAIAASALVVLAIQNLVAVQSRHVTLVAVTFGLVNGFGIATQFHEQVQFAGSHIAVGLDAFVLTLTLVAVGAAALAALLLSLLVDRGIPAIWLSWAVSIYIGHSALHRVTDRLRPTPTGSSGPDQFGLLLVGAWVVGALIAGVIDASRRGRVTGALEGGQS